MQTSSAPSGDFNRETNDATSDTRVAYLTEFAISDYIEIDLSRFDFRRFRSWQRRAKQKPVALPSENVKRYQGHRCHKQHRTYSGLVRCLWPRVRDIQGDGPYAVLAYVECRYDQWRQDPKWRSHHTRIYVTLCPSLDQARRVEAEASDEFYDPDDKGEAHTITECEFQRTEVIPLPQPEDALSLSEWGA